MARIGTWLLTHDWAIEGLFWLVIICIVGLLLTLAAGVIRLAWRTHRAVAVRIDARRVARWAEYYANHPANRRKETP